MRFALYICTNTIKNGYKYAQNISGYIVFYILWITDYKSFLKYTLFPKLTLKELIVLGVKCFSIW